jgi:hypothetical protein
MHRSQATLASFSGFGAGLGLLALVVEATFERAGMPVGMNWLSSPQDIDPSTLISSEVLCCSDLKDKYLQGVLNFIQGNRLAGLLAKQCGFGFRVRGVGLNCSGSEPPALNIIPTQGSKA